MGVPALDYAPQEMKRPYKGLRIAAVATSLAAMSFLIIVATAEAVLQRPIPVNKMAQTVLVCAFFGCLVFGFVGGVVALYRNPSGVLEITAVALPILCIIVIFILFLNGVGN